MLRIQKLSRPTKRSGFRLEPGKATKVRGFNIVNQNGFAVYVDKFTPAYRPKKRKPARRTK